MLTTSLLYGLAVGLACLAHTWFTMPPRQPRAKYRPVQDYTPPTDTQLWTSGHDVPVYPMTVDRAHLEMQRHCGCKRGDCPRKDAAWMALVDAGHIKPRTYTC